jgi:hypothetical protein
LSEAHARTPGEPAALEIVLSRYDEDVTWAVEEYHPFVTVYNKGPAGGLPAVLESAGRSRKLPNVGREGHTYLWHVVNNYDALADWTVFSQAQKPSFGYAQDVSGDSNGHLMAGVSFTVSSLHICPLVSSAPFRREYPGGGMEI